MQDLAIFQTNCLITTLMMVGKATILTIVLTEIVKIKITKSKEFPIRVEIPKIIIEFPFLNSTMIIKNTNNKVLKISTNSNKAKIYNLRVVNTINLYKAMRYFLAIAIKQNA